MAECGSIHLDEYIGLPITNYGSFRKMLLEQLVWKTGVNMYHLLDVDTTDPVEVIDRVGRALTSEPITRQGFSVVVKYCVAKSAGRIANHKLANCANHTISIRNLSAKFVLGILARPPQIAINHKLCRLEGHSQARLRAGKDNRTLADL